jgi:hypothetical protein
LLVLGGLFVVLLVLLLALPPTTERQPTLTVYSAEPAGGKGLRLWLDALGYQVTTLEGDRFAIGKDVSTILVLAPVTSIGQFEQGELERWVRQGGRLIVGADAFLSWQLLGRFGVSVRPSVGAGQAVPAAPGRLGPAIEAVPVEPRFELTLSDDVTGAVPLLVGQNVGSDGRQPLLAVRVPTDRGEVVALTVTDALTNQRLHDEANARLALSLIGPPGRGQVAFDELHHGFGTLARRNIYALLLDQAWGRVLVWGSLLVLLFLLLRGRRLGRSVPVFVDRGRSLGELVTSQASLYRAGGKRAFVAEHLARQLRHDLAQSVGLPGDASDAEIAARASAMGRDPSRALRVLAETGRARSDRALLALSNEGVEVREELRTPQPPAPSPSRGGGGWGLGASTVRSADDR